MPGPGNLTNYPGRASDATDPEGEPSTAMLMPQHHPELHSKYLS